MSARQSAGWQTALADLSLILFMATAAAVSKQPPKPTKALNRPVAAAPSPQGEPLAIYVAAPGAPPLADWIAGQAPDNRQQLTITARYGPGAQAEALAAATRIAREAGPSGAGARIVIEPGAGPPRAVLAFDAAVAQGLRNDAAKPVSRKVMP